MRAGVQVCLIKMLVIHFRKDAAQMGLVSLRVTIFVTTLKTLPRENNIKVSS